MDARHAFVCNDMVDLETRRFGLCTLVGHRLVGG